MLILYIAGAIQGVRKEGRDPRIYCVFVGTCRTLIMLFCFFLVGGVVDLFCAFCSYVCFCKIPLS